jgi:hypothetical protein
MTSNVRTYDGENQIAYDLSLIAEEFRLYPPPEEEAPNPSEWGKFLLEHPEYTNSSAYEALAHRLTSREAFEWLDENLQRLGASLLAVTFSEKELREMA